MIQFMSHLLAGTYDLKIQVGCPRIPQAIVCYCISVCCDDHLAALLMRDVGVAVIVFHRSMGGVVGGVITRCVNVMHKKV